MKRNIKFLIGLLIVAFACQAVFADMDDKRNDFLEEYEVFVSGVEKHAKKKEIKFIESIEKDQKRYMERMDSLGELGDWSFKQVKKYTKLKTKYLTAITSLKTSRGIENSDENIQNMSDSLEKGMKKLGDNIDKGAKKLSDGIEKGLDSLKKSLEELDEDDSASNGKSKSSVDENRKA